METQLCFSQYLRRLLLNISYIICLKNSTILVKAISAPVMWPQCYSPMREMLFFSVVASFLCYSLAILSTRKHLVSRFWQPATDCRLAHPTPSHTPSQDHPSISRAKGPVRSFSCPQVKCKRSLGCLILCTPNFD